MYHANKDDSMTLRRQITFCCRVSLLLFVVSFCSPKLAFSQGTFPPRTTSKVKPTPRQTIIDFEILTPRKGANGLDAQKWGRLFGQLKWNARIRQERFNEKTGITEKMLGKTRVIKVVGTIDTSGKLICNRRAFRLNDVNKMKEWVEELKTFGAQGAPDGKPVWGLTKPQFEIIHRPLKQPLKISTKGLALTEALKKFEFQGITSIRISQEARGLLLKPSSLQKSTPELKGMTQGTGLAILLSQYDLCFRPRRTSRDNIDLLIEPRTGIADPWPFGWDLDDVKLESTNPKIRPNNRLRLAPKLFERTLVQLNDVPLSKVLDSIASQSKIPIFYDTNLIQKKKIDTQTFKVSYPRKRASWNQLLRSVTNQANLIAKLRVDEQTRPFIWVTVPSYGKPK